MQSDEIVVNGDKLQWVLVSISDAQPRTEQMPRAVIEQDHGRFVPHVLGVTVGQEIEIRNEDPFLYSFHPRPRVNAEFNISMPTAGVKDVRRFDRAEPIPFEVNCNIHKWSNAWIAVFDHPFFAVSDANGEFEIAGVPDGEYILQSWHEKLGAKTMKIKVVKGVTTKAEFAFEVK